MSVCPANTCHDVKPPAALTVHVPFDDYYDTARGSLDAKIRNEFLL